MPTVCQHYVTAFLMKICCRGPLQRIDAGDETADDDRNVLVFIVITIAIVIAIGIALGILK